MAAGKGQGQVEVTASGLVCCFLGEESEKEKEVKLRALLRMR